MARAARRFLDGLDPLQRQAAHFPFAGDERYRWDYTPVERDGLMLRCMSDGQRQAALGLMQSALSQRGDSTARRIMQLEEILHQWEEIQGGGGRFERAPDRYWFSVFGEPGGSAPWGWRVGGHHLAVHVTVVDGEQVSAQPMFFGANPAEIRHGEHAGSRALAEEEDWARRLLKSLSAEQKRRAVVDPVAPDDILTKSYRVVHLDGVPLGIRFGDLAETQRQQLVALVRHYVTRANEELAGNYWRHLENLGFDGWSFAWAGGADPGEGHYYAIRGPSFAIEYDNTQNGANHIHSVLRDTRHDWGEDLLAAHYRRGDHPHEP